jgi:hypothetical protein
MQQQQKDREKVKVISKKVNQDESTTGHPLIPKDIHTHPHTHKNNYRSTAN